MMPAWVLAIEMAPAILSRSASPEAASTEGHALLDLEYAASVRLGAFLNSAEYHL